MRWSYQIARLFGIPVRLHLSLLLFMGLVALGDGGLHGVILMSAVFGSVLLHELGHALVARAKGLPIADITLYPFGGMARMTAAPQTTGAEIAIAAAGPVVSFILGFGFWAVAAVTHSPEIWLMAQVNLILGGFNLIPALPMDGGRIFRAILARKVGYFRSTRISAKLARWIALAMAVAGVAYSFWLLVIAAFIYFMSISEEIMARARQYMGDPGYQDAPGPHGGAWDPYSFNPRPGGTRVPGTEWEVLDPDDPGPSGQRQQRPGPGPGDGPHRQAGPGPRVTTDRTGQRITVEWWQSR